MLDNVRGALRLRWTELVAELRRLGDITLADFLAETGLEVETSTDAERGGWVGLRRSAGLDANPAGPRDREVGSAHRSDAAPGRYRLALAALLALRRRCSRPVGRLGRMLHFALWGKTPFDR